MKTLILYNVIFLANLSLSFANTNSWVGITLPDSRKGWVRTNVLIYDLHLSSKVILNKPFNNILVGTQFEVLDVRGNDFKCKYQNSIFWISERYLSPVNNDLGFIITTKKAILKPYSKNDEIKNIKEGLKIKALEFKNGLVKINWENSYYYIDAKNIISRFNFATRIKKTKTDIWYNVKSILYNKVVTENKYIFFQDVNEIYTERKFGYVITDFANVRSNRNINSKVIKKLSRFVPVSMQEIYNLPSIDSIPKTSSARKLVRIKPINIINDLYFNKKSWTSDEIFNRNIFDIVTSKKSPDLMFASANGVFRSVNGGKLWEKLNQFEDKNLPIAIASSGNIYIGQFKSSDGGDNFIPYVKWDMVLKAIQYQGVNQVGLLSIDNINFLDDDENALKLELKLNNNKKTSIVSHDGGNSWIPVIN